MIIGQSTSTTKVSMTNNEHALLSDLAKDIGGTDEGLNPHELVEAALTACTIQTMELYAKRKSWDINGIKVTTTIKQEGPESNICMELEFGELPLEQKKRLVEIAKKCPIHKLLESHVTIDTYEK